RALRRDPARPPRARVLGRLRRREKRVGRLQPRRERGRVQRGAELAEILVALRDLPEEEVGLRADARRGVAAERVEPRREVLDDLGERVLRGRTLLDRQPAPFGGHAEEGVAEVLPFHAFRLAPAREPLGHPVGDLAEVLARLLEDALEPPTVVPVRLLRLLRRVGLLVARAVVARDDAV